MLNMLGTLNTFKDLNNPNRVHTLVLICILQKKYLS